MNEEAKKWLATHPIAERVLASRFNLGNPEWYTKGLIEQAAKQNLGEPVLQVGDRVRTARGIGGDRETRIIAVQLVDRSTRFTSPIYAAWAYSVVGLAQAEVNVFTRVEEAK